LLSALLLRLNIEDESEHYQNVFGLILTVVNMLGIMLIIEQAIVKPFKWLIRGFGRKLTHDGELRGLVKRRSGM